MNILAAIANLEHPGLVTRSFALLADQLDVGEKLHLDRNRAVTLASLAAAAGNVEREVSRAETAFLGLRQRGKQIADRVKGLDIGDRIGARCTTDGRLVNQNNFIDELIAFYAVPGDGSALHAVRGLLLGLRQRFVEHLVQQSRLPRAGHARDGHNHTQRNTQVDAFQIVGPGSTYLDLLRTGSAAYRRQLNAQIVRKVAAGQGRGIVLDFVISSLSDELATILACAGPKIENAIRGSHNVRIVFDHQDGIFQVTQI